MKISRTKKRTKWFTLKVHAETGQRLPDDAKADPPDAEVPTVDEIRICLKYLTGGQLDSLQDRRITTRVRGSRGTAETDFKYSDFAAQKRALAVEDWEGIIDEETGEKLAITPDSMKLLDGWFCEWLIETIDDMNNLGEELRGE